MRTKLPKMLEIYAKKLMKTLKSEYETELEYLKKFCRLCRESVDVATIFGFYVHNACNDISTKNCGMHINVYQRNRISTKQTTHHRNIISPKRILETTNHNLPMMTTTTTMSSNMMIMMVMVVAYLTLLERVKQYLS